MNPPSAVYLSLGCCWKGAKNVARWTDSIGRWKKVSNEILKEKKSWDVQREHSLSASLWPWSFCESSDARLRSLGQCVICSVRERREQSVRAAYIVHHGNSRCSCSNWCSSNWCSSIWISRWSVSSYLATTKEKARRWRPHLIQFNCI